MKTQKILSLYCVLVMGLFSSVASHAANPAVQGPAFYILSADGNSGTNGRNPSIFKYLVTWSVVEFISGKLNVSPGQYYGTGGLPIGFAAPANASVHFSLSEMDFSTGDVKSIINFDKNKCTVVKDGINRPCRISPIFSHGNNNSVTVTIPNADAI